MRAIYSLAGTYLEYISFLFKKKKEVSSLNPSAWFDGGCYSWPYYNMLFPSVGVERCGW